MRDRPGASTHTHVCLQLPGAHMEPSPAVRESVKGRYEARLAAHNRRRPNSYVSAFAHHEQRVQTRLMTTNMIYTACPERRSPECHRRLLESLLWPRGGAPRIAHLQANLEHPLDRALRSLLPLAVQPFLPKVGEHQAESLVLSVARPSPADPRIGP